MHCERTYLQNQHPLALDAALLFLSRRRPPLHPHQAEAEQRIGATAGSGGGVLSLPLAEKGGEDTLCVICGRFRGGGVVRVSIG